MIKSTYKHPFLVILVIVMMYLFAGHPKYVHSQSWAYLGQTPPGLIPERFPPDSLLANNIWLWHSTAVFSPDSTEMFFSKYFQSTGRLEMVYMKYENNHWTGPSLPSFADTIHSYNCPVFSIGGDTLYYISSEPPFHILFTTRDGQGWNTPNPINIPYPPGAFLGHQFSIANDHSIYFEIWENNQVDLYYSQYNNGVYEDPVPLPGLNTNYYDWGPFIDYNDEFIIFSSNRPGGYGLNDLYISTKNMNGGWNEPVNLGTPINSTNEESYPLISFDDQYFFFTTQKPGDLGYNPYWVDSQVIYDIVTGVNDNSRLTENKTIELKQNYPNPFKSNITVEYITHRKEHIMLKIYDINKKEIYTLVDELKTPGVHSVNIDRNSLKTGFYYYQLMTETSVTTRKMVLID